MWAKGAYNWTTGNGWFSATALEQAIAEILEYRLPLAESADLDGLTHEAGLRDPLEGSCKMCIAIPKASWLSIPNANPINSFVCAVNTDTHDCVRLRSYDVPTVNTNNNLFTCTIIEAARATAAAPTYFPTARIGTSTFFDDAMKNNNPILEVIKEVHGPLSNQPVRCLVSIGTGTTERPLYRPGMTGLVKALTRLATDTEAKHEEVMKDVEYENIRAK